MRNKWLYIGISIVAAVVMVLIFANLDVQGPNAEAETEAGRVRYSSSSLSNDAGANKITNQLLLLDSDANDVGARMLEKSEPALAAANASWNDAGIGIRASSETLNTSDNPTRDVTIIVGPANQRHLFGNAAPLGPQ